uniref:Uncharacterized protein n=1 Tax=Quercus lobata TaxID=97700 RepID=A0A7N2R2S7_QUELO
MGQAAAVLLQRFNYDQVNDDSDGPSGVSKWQNIIGFLYTLRAFALHSLSLSLMHFPFQKVLNRETYLVVLEMQICTALVATCVSIVGNGRLFVWKCTASLAITPIAFMIVFHDKMNGIKEIAMLLAIWGFASHI